MEDKLKGLERCGACGDFNCDAQTLNSLTEIEIAQIPLGYCGCEQDEPRYVTRDMAIDAGDRSLEGQRY
jgi:hypothetical protein